MILAVAALVNISVFSLFHPTELWVTAAGSTPLRVQSDATKARLEGRQVRRVRLGQNSAVRVTSLDGGPVEFRLIVPGRFERQFRGLLSIQTAGTELRATVAMDLETAVASVVAAESVPGAALEALKAQAIVARSFYVGSPLEPHGRHQAFDFCDTTHCQFIKATPSPKTAAFRAAEETRGLILTYQSRIFPAFYSAACGGRTRALANPSGYPYFAVECEYCRRHPRDPVRGHRFGLCQQGAAGMAAGGSSFREILNHYYPAATIARGST